MKKPQEKIVAAEFVDMKIEQIREYMYFYFYNILL